MDREKLEAVAPIQANARFQIVKRPYHIVEAVLIELLKDIRSRHLPVHTVLLRALAHEVYTVLWNWMGSMPFPRPVFGYSWVEGFKGAWALEYHKMEDKAGSVDMDAIAGDINRIKGMSRFGAETTQLLLFFV